MQKDERIVYLSLENTEIQQYFNIPERNTALLLLGKGSSITDSAARKRAESNVMVGFFGFGGTPLLSTVDYAFLTPQSEYGPTEYMQGWGRKWFDESARLRMAQILVEARVRLCEEFWGKDPLNQGATGLRSAANGHLIQLPKPVRTMHSGYSSR